ncbi:MAG TPA: rhodanese-like domain-containing protein, partial [Acetobacteraceae bacterium]|nr:rhodanese-like domain-containing protein [Acetobacteraceae bacterium]
MGRADVMVVDGALEGAVPVQPAAAPAGIGLPALDAAMARKALVVDLARSIDFRAGHIPGAVWGMRSRLEMLAPQLSAAPEVVLTCPDGVLAARAVPEAMRLTPAPVSALAGGTASWRRAGRALMADRTDPPDEACVDFYLRPYDRNSGIEEAMHAYLSWEIDLVAEIARDGTVVFGAPG